MKSKSINIKMVRAIDDHIPSFYYTHHLPNGHVGDELVEYVDEWTSRNPILIDAPTGCGKTTFVYQELITRAMRRDMNILIISNRIAVSVQQKLEVMKRINCSKLDKLTELGIREEEIFDFVGITTYQHLKTFIESNEKWCKKLLYVVADEAHFFSADSLFNRECDECLYLVTRKFCHAIRIYLTATPWDVMVPLAEAEINNYCDYNEKLNIPPWQFYDERFFYHYCFKRDYSSYNLNYFDDISFITNLINQSTKDKWLIFIDNKDKAKEFQKNIKSKSVFIDASQKDSATWKKLMLEQRFEHQVLISTSVIDCGVNIKDNDLKNVVISSDSRTSIMQMVGRKRLAPNETINIWIYGVDSQTIANRYRRYSSLQSLEVEYYNCKTESQLKNFIRKLWENEDPLVRILFSIDSEEVSINKTAFFHLSRRIDFYQDLLKGKTTFKGEVNKWFEIAFPDIVDELSEFYNAYAGKELSENEQNELRQIIVKAYRAAGNTEAQPRRIHNLRHTALNNRLRAIKSPFEIITKNDNWELIYIGTEEEKP